jgi:hypothetical protein
VASSVPDQLIGTLLQDVHRANRGLREPGDAYARRTAFRTMFAALEGFTAFLKWNALERVRRRPGLYTTAELALLNEEAYELANSGVPVARVRFLPTLNNFLFAYAMFTKHTRAPAFPVKAPEWAQMKAAVLVRHRITHPRTAADLAVTAAEIREARAAFLWLASLLPPAIAALKEDLVSRRPPPGTA